MTVYSTFEESSLQPGLQELALGFFDGLHVGHREVIVGRRHPAELGHTAMLSFRNHPQSVLFRDRPLKLITGLPHKQKILADWGIQHMVLLPFDKETAQKKPEAFLAEIRKGFPALRSVRIGENFRFGHQRTGTPELLKEWGSKEKLLVEIIPSLNRDGMPVSSSRIRHQLSQQDLVGASSLLGRPYSLYGRVVEGEKIGASLGFPTANLETDDGSLLPVGVYFGQARTEKDGWQAAAINIGTRPTVSGNGKITIEAHLPGYHGNLYGQFLDLEVKGFLRHEIKFNSRAELTGQLAKDSAKALQLSGL